MKLNGGVNVVRKESNAGGKHKQVTAVGNKASVPRDLLKDCVQHPSELPGEVRKLRYLVSNSHPTLEGCSWGLNTWHFQAVTCRSWRKQEYVTARYTSLTKIVLSRRQLISSKTRKISLALPPFLPKGRYKFRSTGNGTRRIYKQTLLH